MKWTAISQGAPPCLLAFLATIILMNILRKVDYLSTHPTAISAIAVQVSSSTQDSGLACEGDHKDARRGCYFSRQTRLCSTLSCRAGLGRRIQLECGVPHARGSGPVQEARDAASTELAGANTECSIASTQL
eukprot:1243477-Pleurochrysis_carterae.AAC.1